jgi:alkaline phosphatase D
MPARLFRFIFCVLCLMAVSSAHAQSKTFKVAFGSCARQTSKEQLWNEITQQKPNVWMWIGDNVYADTHNMDTLRRDYNVQKSHADYQQLMKMSSIIGTWDDHDYGANDGGKFYSKRKQSKEELLRFLDVSKDAEVRQHTGVYQSYTYGENPQAVKLILLDTRYFRDTLERASKKRKRYKPSPTGDILGEEQWAWLEKELTNSTASVHIIASSIQFLSNDHAFEKWGNFPKARKRMFGLLVKTQPAGAIFVSGDRHIAEFSRKKIKGLPYMLYDFTSSGLTHTWNEPWEEKNRLRVGKIIAEKNYGLISIDWTNEKPQVTMQVFGKNNKRFAEVKTDFTN